MIILNCDQRSEDWFKARAGIPTASCFDKIVTMKGEPSKQAQKYMYKLAGEFVSGKPEESYTNAAMERGILLEDEARRTYSLITENVVDQVGFCLDEKGYGCSPDGFVGDDGLIEIKCPSVAVQVEYLLGQELPSDYYQQVQGQLLVTGRKWCDFTAYYPGIQPLIVRVYPDQKFQAALKSELIKFVQELQTIINKIK